MSFPAIQSFKTHTITTALGGLLSNGFKTTPRSLQADERVTSIVNKQLKNGIQLPVINRITFDPATLVHKVGTQLEKGILSYSYLKGDENSLLIYIHNIYNTRELIYSSNGTRKEIQFLLKTGVFFESASALRTLAIQQEAKQVYVQFESNNERLVHILSKKHPLVGHHPFYFPDLARPMFLGKSLSPVFEITQAISKNPASYFHAAAGTPLITNSDCQSLQDEMRATDSTRLKDETQKNENK